jgi:sialate O-acetylesterase
MVLQREPYQSQIWGWASPPNATVTVTLQDSNGTILYTTSFLATPSSSTSDGAAVATTSDKNDDTPWFVQFPPQPAGSGHAIDIVVVSALEDANTNNNTKNLFQLTLEDIAFGDVYLCSGQSNMEMSLSAVWNASTEIDDSIHYPHLRLATVALATSDTPQWDVPSATHSYSWARSSPSAITPNQGPFSWFSAVCYFMGRSLYTHFDGQVPIGLVAASWGGQPVEVFSSPTALADETCGGLRPASTPSTTTTIIAAEQSSSSLFKQAQNEQRRAEMVNRRGGEEEDRGDSRTNNGGHYNDGVAESFLRNLTSTITTLQLPAPSQIWNAMIHPLTPMRFVGIVWYQGEANWQNLASYACRMPAMITDWRRHFSPPQHQQQEQQQEDLVSFVYVQLAAWTWNDDRSATWPYLRAAQDVALQLPKVGMATAIDLGDPKSPQGSIHSRLKQPIGQRLALTLRAIHYQDVQHNYRGPVVTSVQIVNGTNLVRLGFEPGTAIGLHLHGTTECSGCCSDESPFKALGPDGLWQAAHIASIEDETMTLSSAETPVLGIRLAWQDYPQCGLYNGGVVGGGGPEDASCLPAAPFQWCAYPTTGKAAWSQNACGPATTSTSTTSTVGANDDSTMY